MNRTDLSSVKSHTQILPGRFLPCFSSSRNSLVDFSEDTSVCWWKPAAQRFVHRPADGGRGGSSTVGLRTAGQKSVHGAYCWVQQLGHHQLLGWPAEADGRDTSPGCRLGSGVRDRGAGCRRGTAGPARGLLRRAPGAAAGRSWRGWHPAGTARQTVRLHWQRDAEENHVEANDARALRSSELP